MFENNDIASTAVIYEKVIQCLASLFLPDRAFIIDSSQSNIYLIFGASNGVLYLNQLNALNGVINYSLSFISALQCSNSYWSIDISPDDSAIFIAGNSYLSPYNGALWKISTSSAVSVSSSFSYFTISSTQVFGQILVFQQNQVYVPGVVSSNTLFMAMFK